MACSPEGLLFWVEGGSYHLMTPTGVAYGFRNRNRETYALRIDRASLWGFGIPRCFRMELKQIREDPRAVGDSLELPCEGRPLSVGLGPDGSFWLPFRDGTIGLGWSAADSGGFQLRKLDAPPAGQVELLSTASGDILYIACSDTDSIAMEFKDSPNTLRLDCPKGSRPERKSKYPSRMERMAQMAEWAREAERQAVERLQREGEEAEPARSWYWTREQAEKHLADKGITHPAKASGPLPKTQESKETKGFRGWSGVPL